MDYSHRLLSVIPGGAHVHTKGPDQFPSNAPKITSRGAGVYLYDHEGNKFLDYGMALRSVIIGYGEESINQGAINQINNGNTSTFPSMIELEAAERLRDLIDSVDMVKFCKDGSTATTAAVKLARAYTGRKIILRCSEQPFFSYNDWFIGTTRWKNGCLPEDYQYTKLFGYNDIQSVETLIQEYPDQIACVILEPALSIMEPEGQFLSSLRELCNKNGIIFILDEMITGFRWHLKGAQHYYGVSPDLCTFGKAMANGFSVSALAGRRELMEMGDVSHPDKVFLLSTTHGAEMSSLGAFIATLDFLEGRNVLSHVWQYGEALIKAMNDIATDIGISQGFRATGLGCLPYFQTFNKKGLWDATLNGVFQREMVNHGVIMRNIAIAYRHGEKELELTKSAVRESLIIYQQHYERSTM